MKKIILRLGSRLCLAWAVCLGLMPLLELTGQAHGELHSRACAGKTSNSNCSNRYREHTACGQWRNASVYYIGGWGGDAGAFAHTSVHTSCAWHHYRWVYAGATIFGGSGASAHTHHHTTAGLTAGEEAAAGAEEEEIEPPPAITEGAFSFSHVEIVQRERVMLVDFGDDPLTRLQVDGRGLSEGDASVATFELAIADKTGRIVLRLDQSEPKLVQEGLFADAPLEIQKDPEQPGVYFVALHSALNFEMAGSVDETEVETGGTAEQIVEPLPCTPPSLTMPAREYFLDACRSNCVTLVAPVGGSDPMNLQWFLNGAAIIGATQSVYEICPVGAADEGQYTIGMSNPCGTTNGLVATVRLVPGTEPPILTCPSNVVVSTCSSNGTSVTFDAPTAVNAAGELLPVSCSHASGDIFPVGTTTVVCSATDGCGNTVRCVFTVTVNLLSDAPAPLIFTVTPTEISTLGGTPMLVRGENFLPSDEVLIGGELLLDALPISSQEIRGRAPVLPAGMHDVWIRRCDQIVARLVGAVTAEDALMIRAVEPDTVLARGGARVTVYGRRFGPDTRIRIGFPSADGESNLLRILSVAEDGGSLVGIIPPLPAGELYGSRAVLVEDPRGRALLEAGLRYEPNPVETDPQVLAMRRLEALSTRAPSWTVVNGLMRGVNLRLRVPGADAAERARRFLSDQREIFGLLMPERDLMVARVDSGETDHVLLRQTHAGLPVAGAEMLVSLTGDEVYSAVGAFLPAVQLQRLNTAPGLTADEAVALVLQAFDRPAEFLPAEPSLEIFDLALWRNAPSHPRLAWRLQLGGERPVEVFVDAQTGEMLFTYSLNQEHGYDMAMRDALGMTSTNCFSTANLPLVGTDNTFFNAAYNGNADAVAAYQQAEDAYDYFHDNFGFHSYDGNAAQLRIFINSGVNNAMWSPGCKTMQFRNGWVDYEVMVHELTHGVIGSGSNLKYAFESGALNESYADIMGAVADREAGDLNWTLAEDRTSGNGPIRSLSDPTLYGDPDRYFLYTPGTPDGNGDYPDNGGVHSNSGIGNKAAYLLAQGGNFNGLYVSGVGLSKMRDLKFHALRHLPSNAQFIDARNFEVATAEAWAQNNSHGFTSTTVCSVRRAWAAVDVGWPDLNCDGVEEFFDSDGDGVPNWSDNCPLNANPSQADSDGDGVGNVCDNCQLLANPDQTDTDGDGQGDVCDPDDDNDGCVDSVDQHPGNSMVPIGKYIGVCCDGALLGFEGADSDSDGLKNCEDLDDDNDGIPDDQDGCPVGDFGPLGCTVFEDCPCPPKFWWLICKTGGCNELFAKFTELINPDPTREVIFDHVQVANKRLYLFPNAGNTARQGAQAIMGNVLAGMGGGGGGSSEGQNLWRLEIWSRATADSPAQLQGVVAEFDPMLINFDQIDLGHILQVIPPEGENPMSMGATWYVGQEPNSAATDSDLDGLPDGWETAHGLDPYDASDADRDHDGDGLNNRQEFEAQTDPGDASSFFGITNMRHAGDHVAIEVNTILSQTYQLERAQGLSDAAWVSVGGPFVGTGGLVEVVDTDPAPEQAFYRVRLVLP